MKLWSFLCIFTLSIATALANAQDSSGTANPSIDMDGHLRVSLEAARHREARRVSEADFIRMSRERGTVMLDARSRQRFDELHISYGYTNAYELGPLIDRQTSRLEFESSAPPR